MTRIKTKVEFIDVSGRTLSKRVCYFENGLMAQKGTYGVSQNGWEWNVPIGVEERYYENGQLECRLVYNNFGHLDGECLFYNKAGKLIRKRVYAKDLLLEEIDYLKLEPVPK